MSSKNSVMSNMIWRFAERCGAQSVAFVVSIVLARLLSPDVYGTVALITVFIAVLQVFVDSGLGNALIQKKDADDIDFSTVFYTNILFCTVLYILIFIGAPAIATFYKDMSMVAPIRVLSLTVLISGIKNVQQAYVSRHMLFKKFFFSTLGGTIAAAVVGIIVALNGGGIWALVAQQVLNLTMDTMILWFTVRWRPVKVFSLKRLKRLYSFGWKLLVSSLVDRIYTEIRQLIIGRMYSSADLAYYNRGLQFPNLVATNINTSIDSVLLPAMSNEQDDKARVKEMTRRSIKVGTYIMAPLMVGMAVTGTSLISFVLTDKWLMSVPYLRIFCITMIFYPIHTANLNAIKAMGRSDLFLTLEILKKAVGMVLLLVTMNISVMAMAYSLLISSVASQIINSWPNKKLLNYRYLEQLKDIMPGVTLAVAMGLAIYPIQLIIPSAALTMFIQVVCGGVIYVLGSMLFKLDSFVYLYNLVVPRLKRK